MKSGWVWFKSFTDQDSIVTNILGSGHRAVSLRSVGCYPFKFHHPEYYPFIIATCRKLTNLLLWITQYLSPHDLIDLCYTFSMTKEQFFKRLRVLLKYRVKPKSVPCRCIGCCGEKQKRSNTPASIS